MRPLWPHQIKALDMSTAAFKGGARSICIVMPTGAGKSTTGASLCSRHLEKKPDGRVLWVTHREELLGQSFDELEAWGLRVGAIGAGTSKTVNSFRPVQVASIQTLLARNLRPECSMMVCDEFHHMASDKWAEFAMHYRRNRVPMIGLTATPVRGDGRGFEGLVDELVCPVTMRELIDGGFLVPYELIHPPRTLRSDQIAQRPVDAYLAHAPGRKAIVFATNIKSIHEYVDQFNTAGVPAGGIWGDMPRADRRAALDRYKRGDVQVLVSVGVLTEGFDDRATSCVILARGIGSLSLYLQTVGRGLRISPETGKQNAIILDLHGTCLKEDFGAPDDPREWTLEGDGVVHKTKEQTGDRFCKVCAVLLEHDAGLVCDFCEHVKPEACPPSVLDLKLQRYAAKMKEPPDQRKTYFQKLVAIGRDKKYDRWWPHSKYKGVYGSAPDRSWYA